LAAGLSQAELAERAGLSTDGIGALESGRRASPRLYTVRALADALALSEAERIDLIDAAQAGSVAIVSPAPAPAAEGTWDRLPAPPRPPTRLIGREREAAEIAFALQSGRTRLLTLTGPGGVGKTRLAIAAAEAIGAALPAGVAWVELAHISAPPDVAASRVAAAIASALGVREATWEPLAAPLAAAIGAREMLLILDNVEHLLAAAPLVADLLAACPGLAVLATSRERLGLRGEREFAVLPLEAPSAFESSWGPADGISNVAAVRLFVERAAEVRGDFALTEATAPAVAELCRQLDGLPLAIELAVGWLKVLPPDALAAQLAPRLPLLNRGAADLPDRQRTMRAAIAWSYEVLRPEDQRLFRRLGVFAGGFTLEAAEWVTGVGCRVSGTETDTSTPSPVTRHPSPETLALVAALVDKSLVRPLAAAGSETGPRFGMLETIREFALEQLAARGEEPVTRVAHAHYFARLVDTLRRLAGAQKDALDLLQTEHANVRAALEWLDAEGSAADFVHLASLLPGFWSRGGHLREGGAWLERALTKADMAAADDQGRVQVGLGMVLTWQGEHDAAEPLFAAGIPLLRASGNIPDLATALFWHSTLASFRGDHDRAEIMLSEVLALTEAGTDQQLATARMASALDNLGILAKDRGDFALAETRLAEALRLRDAHGFDLAAAVSVVGLAAVAYARGDYHLAIERYRESFARFGERGEQHHEASALAGVACSAAALGHVREAARLFGAAQAVLEQAGMHAFEPAWQANVERHIAVVQRDLGDEAFGRFWAEGRARSWAGLMDEVAALSELAPATPMAMPAPVRRGSRGNHGRDHGD
jgi:predicted ATPase/transcriptional regulator with XRE-family HTH domain